MAGRRQRCCLHNNFIIPFYRWGDNIHSFKRYTLKGGYIMWNIEPNFNLPEGFQLKQDEDFVYVIHEDSVKAILNNNTNIDDILAVCENIQKKG